MAHTAIGRFSADRSIASASLQLLSKLPAASLSTSQPWSRRFSSGLAACRGTPRSQAQADRPSTAFRSFTTSRSFRRQVHDGNSPSSVRVHLDIGLAYASKNTPPFVTPQEAAQSLTTGFTLPTDEAELIAGKRSNRWIKVARWKDAQLALGGGRVELLGAEPQSKAATGGESHARSPPAGHTGQNQQAEGEVEEEHEQRRRQQANEAQRRAWGAGEDFFFVGDEGHAKCFLAVSDGVGGWTTSGVDPSLFAQSLMFHGHQHVTKNPSARVSDVLGRAYAGVLGEQDVKCGSATACVVSIDTQRATLEAANLGDSGYAILRPSSVNDSASSYQVIYSSPSQTHYFNCPRQLTKLEPGADAEGMVMDLPEHADVTRQQLKPGDMVILFTDGLSDNVHPQQIEALLSHVDRTLNSPANSFLLPSERRREKARLFADVLVAYARLLMAHEDVVSPFERAAASEGLRYKGGKIDDVTVVTALVSEAD